MLTRAISYELAVHSFGKTFAQVRNCLLYEENVGCSQIESWKNKIIDENENDTKRKIQQVLCKN